jgi:hypothetical protein
MEIEQQGTELVRNALSKKQIESASVELVRTQMEDGYIDPVTELVMASKLSAFFAARVDALRPHALQELGSDKSRGALGAKVEKSSTPGRWNYADEYLEQLKGEVKIVEAKSQLADEKDRHHITLSGEAVILKRAGKTPGGETVKVSL